MLFIYSHLAWGIFLCHWFGDPKNDRSALAVMLAGVGTARYFATHGHVQLALVLAECVGLTVMGCFGRHHVYLIAGMSEIIAVGWSPAHSIIHLIPGEILILAGGLLFFGVGIAVTFQKSRILEWLERRPHNPTEGRGTGEHSSI